jgi:hypothetical protein
MTESGHATVPALLQDVLNKGKAYNADNAASQKELFQATKALSNALQPPLERIAQLSMHEVLRNS